MRPMLMLLLDDDEKLFCIENWLDIDMLLA
jgi:hypothetical protein